MDAVARAGAALAADALHRLAQLDDALTARLRERLLRDCSPRHLPDQVIAVDEVPRTLPGKLLEVPVKRILSGAAPDDVVGRSSLANPDALAPFVALAARREPTET